MRIDTYRAENVPLDIAEGDAVLANRATFAVVARKEMDPSEQGGNVAMLSLRKPQGRKVFCGYLKACGVCLISE